MNAASNAELERLESLTDEAFRLEVRGWISVNYPPEMQRHPARRLFWRETKPWFGRLSEKGWIAPAWPKEFGGMGLTGSRQLIMIEEIERFGAARFNDQGLLMLGPLIIRYGTQEQKAFFLPSILSGEHIWAQCYSEPNAGSDLAALRLDAEDKGDHWVLNGQKTWITLGTDANWAFVLARTDKSGRKQEGISFLLVPVDSPGLTMRGITNLDLGDEFAEMFFENVVVPKSMVLGEVNKGWTYAKALLGFERIAIGSPKLSSNALARLKELANDMGVADDPEFVATYRKFLLDLADLKALYEAVVASVGRGEELGPEVSILKIVQTELAQRITEAGLAIAGESAGLREALPGGLHPSGQYLLSRTGTIFGGSSEILRNVIAKASLGDAKQMTKALEGIRVLDLTRVFAGPWASQMLADFGADVVKVEHPVGGDEVRRMGPAQKDLEGKDTPHTSSYLAMNRNKRSLSLDMSSAAGQSTLRELAAKADVLIENFKVGGLAKFGLDYESLSKVNPRLIYCSITGYGQSGPYSAQPGYDPVFQALSGLMSITGQPDNSPGAGPVLVGYSVSDINAGLYATISILTALRARDAVTGKGQHVDIGLLDTQIAAHSHIVQNYLASGKTPVRAGAASQILTPWQVFPTADGQLMVAVGNDRQFADFSKAIGRAELASDVRFAKIRDRMPHKAALIPEIEAALAEKTALEWVDVLNAAGVACGPLHTIASMIDDPQVVHRGILQEMPDPNSGRLRFVANPIRMSDTPVAYDRPPPRLGEHSSEVLTDWLKLDPAAAEAILAKSCGAS